jgi:hypothetical protein
MCVPYTSFFFFFFEKTCYLHVEEAISKDLKIVRGMEKHQGCGMPKKLCGGCEKCRKIGCPCQRKRLKKE